MKCLFPGALLMAALASWQTWADSPKKKKVSWPQPVPSPKANPTTPAKVALGKLLFFDPRLSGNNRMSCASCHRPSKGWSDGRPRARGHGGKLLSRNTPTVLNVGYLPRLLWDGRVSSLEEQALGPIQSPEEMNQNLARLEKELQAVPVYRKRFKAVFGTGVTRQGIAQALAAFQRTLRTGSSPYDRYRGGDRKALSELAQRGMRLFFGEAGCSECHREPTFSDGKFYRLGVAFQDKGLGAVTKKTKDNYKFRTPPLRNVAQTGPYMHDGSLKTLRDVVFFYYRGTPRPNPDRLPLDIEPMTGRSFSEVSYLVAFLKALSGEPPRVTPPELP